MLPNNAERGARSVGEGSPLIKKTFFRIPNSAFRAVVLLLLAASAHAATRTAATCSQADVQSAVNQAAAGDTVSIPAGTCGWTTPVSWSAPANVTLKGAGTSVTGGGDQTVIIDNFNSGSPLLEIHVPPGGVFRLTGITFQSGSITTYKDAGTIGISGGTVRLDHLHLNFTLGQNYKILSFDGVTGVLDHSILYLQSTNAIYLFNSGSDGMANDTWAADTGFGTGDFFFVEDNVINGSPSSHDSRVSDLFWGGKIVVRFNTITAACGYEVHGTGSWGNGRGARAAELYGNIFQQSTGQSEPNRLMADFSSGPSLVWGNSANGVFKQPYVSHSVRSDNVTYNQSPTPTGWGYCGTAFNGTGSMWDGGTALGTNTLYGYPCLDQAGRGKGDLMQGNHPNKLNRVTGSLFWPHQALEPIYVWANGQSPAAGWGGQIWSADGNRFAQDRDYYMQASGVQTSATNPFNGTTGTGWGTLANRPVVCTPGVGYFAADQGSWNTSTSNTYGVQLNGSDGLFYKCTSPITWTLYYTPYTYPHPLQGGAVSPPPPSGSACDLNGDSSTNVSDVQLCANQAIGVSACSTGDINQDSSCNVIDVQRVVNNALGGQCVTQ